VRAVVRGLGLENRLYTPCGELSGGEQQRVAVARSIVVNPQVLLADEPTGNLDEELSIRMMDIFKQFHAYGTTVVLATHSKELIESHPNAKLMRIEDGKIVAANWSGAAIFRGADQGFSPSANDDESCRLPDTQHVAKVSRSDEQPSTVALQGLAHTAASEEDSSETGAETYRESR